MNGFDPGIITDMPVFEALIIVIAAIIIDAVLGAIRAIQAGEFSWQELPRFLGTNVLPYGFGLIVLALAAEYQGEPFNYMFYPTAVAVIIRYVAKIKEKIQDIFGLDVKGKRK